MTNSSGKKPKSVKSLLNQREVSSTQAGFGKILAHARDLMQLDKMLASFIDPALAPHCQVAEMRKHSLILVCSSAAFAARIRMISQQLLDAFNEEGEFGIERIEIRIAPVNRPLPEVRKPRTLSSAAVQALGRFASDSGDAEILALFDKINARLNQ